MNKPLIEVGQRYRERDGRFNRIVEVVEISENTGVRPIAIRTLDPATGSRGRKTWASRERFDGRSGGYELCPAAQDGAQ